MSIAKEIRNDIMLRLRKIEDVKTLRLIQNQLEAIRINGTKEEVPSFMEVTTIIKENTSLDEIMAEQNYQPITYEEFRAKAEQLEWDESLDELLAALSK